MRRVLLFLVTLVVFMVLSGAVAWACPGDPGGGICIPTGGHPQNQTCLS